MIEALAIGRFDGLHLGHFELFNGLGNNGAILLIDTKKSNLTLPQFLNRYTHLQVFKYELDAIKELSAAKFVEKLKIDFPKLKKVVVGEDFRFAAGRSGGVDELRQLFDGETIVVPELKINGIGVHSKFIRSLLIDGKVKEAAKFLGRNYEIFGTPVKGQGIGAQKLVATINLFVDSYILPCEGVYATTIEINKKIYQSVTFVGHRVSTDGNFAVETHILDDFDCVAFDGAFVVFIGKIRNNMYFDTVDELKKAIISDISAARAMLSSG